VAVCVRVRLCVFWLDTKGQSHAVCAGVSVLRVLPAWVRGRWSFVCSCYKAQPARLSWSADSVQLAPTQYLFCGVDYSIPSHVVVTQCCAGWRADVINVRWLSLLCGMHTTGISGALRGSGLCLLQAK
jgi:hypothetical protein